MENSKVERINLPQSAPYTMVYVDRCDNKIPYGEFVNSYLDEPMPFAGFCDLVLKMDYLYDYLDFPKASRENRFFSKHRKSKSDRLDPYIKRFYNYIPIYEKRKKRGDILTFFIKTRFRQYGSWQGTIIWLGEDHISEDYSSTLQCMRLMDEALKTVLWQK